MWLSVRFFFLCGVNDIVMDGFFTSSVFNELEFSGLFVWYMPLKD